MTPNIQIGTVAQGSSFNVTRTGTNENPILNFTLVRGDKGDVGSQGPVGATGNGIATIVKTSTVGLVDTYTITYTNGNTTTFTVTNGEDGEVTETELNELRQQVEDLEDNQRTNTASGTEIYISDSAKAKNRSIGLTGRSTQESTNGKNKFNALAISREIYPRVTINSDGSELLIDDSATENGYPIGIVSNLCPTLQIGDKIKFTFETNAVRNNVAVTYIYLDTIARTLYKNQVLEVTQDVLDSKIFIYRGSTTGCYYNNFMVLLESETDTSWEKYTNGASPNPSYEQPIKSCGDSGSVNEKVQTKNLFDTGTQKSDYSRQSVINDIVNNEVKINVLSSGSTCTYRFQDFKGNQTYTITAEASAANNRLYVRIRSSDNTRWLTSSDVSLTGWSYNAFYEGWFKEFITLSIQTVVNIPQCKYCQFGIGYGSIPSIIDTVQTISNIQIEQGSTATDYIPHEEQTHTIPTQQPMRNIGDVRDKFNEDNKTEDHYIARKIFDGTEEWTRGQVGNIYRFSTTLSDILAINARNIVLSNYFKYNGDVSVNIHGIIFASNKNIFIYPDENITTVSELKAWIAEKYANGTPLYVDYILAEPINLPYTEEQKEAWEQIKKARTYKGGTIILSEDETPATVDIEYVVDVNTIYDRVTALENIINS